MIKNKFINEIYKFKKAVFISPHLDDAIFSAGGLIEKLCSHGTNVTIVNVFTAPSQRPYTISIKKFIRSCGYTDAGKLYEDRVAEDLAVAKVLGAKVINLGFVDALWRRRTSNTFAKYISKFIPEFGYLYPIFRLTIAKGYVSNSDAGMINKIKDKLYDVVKEDSDTIIFGPVGIGKHTDHIIVRDVISKLYPNAIYWEDYPYTESKLVDNNFLISNDLTQIDMKILKSKKEILVNSYPSQTKAIFGDTFATVKDTEAYYSKNRTIHSHKLGILKFDKSLNKTDQSKDYSVSIYTDSKLKKYFVKKWIGNKKNIAYKWLVNEIAVYNTMDLVELNIYVPKLVDVVENLNSLSLVVEYIDGSTLSKFESNKKVNIYLNILDSLTSDVLISKHNGISNRSAMFWILISPLISLKAISKNSRHWKLILSGLLKIFISAPFLISRNKRAFIHRDLNDQNVIVRNKSIWLIDFELACIADPIIDWAILILKYATDTDFINKLKSSKQYKRINSNWVTQICIETYITIFSIYDLCHENGFKDVDIDVLKSINKFV